MVSKLNGAPALLKALQVLAEELDRDVPMTYFLGLLRVAVAGDAGIDMLKLQDELEMSSAGTARFVQAFGPVHYQKDRKGFDVIERVTDPKDLRRRTLKLTAKGIKAVSRALGEIK